MASSPTPRPISPDQRSRLLALIGLDDELTAWLDDQRQLSGSEDKALDFMVGLAHLSKRDAKSARLLGHYRNVLAEPTPTCPERAPVVTPDSAAWFVRQISEFLPSEPELLASLTEQQRELEAAGQSRAEAVAIVVRRVLAMERDGQKPLDGHSPLARAIRVAGQKILTAQWKPESTFNPLDDSFQRAEQIASASRVEELHHPSNVVSIGPNVENSIDADTGTGSLKIGVQP